jgi:GTPase
MLDTEKDNRKLVERAILIGVFEGRDGNAEAREHLDELEELSSNLNIPVIKKLTVRLKHPQPKFLIGSGKAEEILDLIKEMKADCLIFDNDLLPSQQRNWERLTKICVIDRQEVILDIFAQRASTREAVLQVHLARMRYSLPRLTRAWTHLSRQKGGNKGTRGEGEKQIEVDRRLVQQRINLLQKELKVVRRHRDTQRKGRDRHNMPHAAIVGYTNAGKSSLLNHLTGATVLAEDKLFATLDPTTRKLELPDKQSILLTDTVGFIRKLPHSLVEAFKSTLEEAVLADFLLLILDISSGHIEEHWETTLSVLRELGADDKRIVTVFNKMDLQNDPVVLARVKSLFPDAIFISSMDGQGIEELLQVVMRMTNRNVNVMQLKIPPQRHDIAALAHAKTQILESEYDDIGNLLLTAVVPQIMSSKFTDFAVS